MYEIFYDGCGEFLVVVVLGMGFYVMLVLFFIDSVVFIYKEIVFNVWLILIFNWILYLIIIKMV